jgi:hypothetical protein
MVGTTLVEIRDHVEALASDDGSYVVHCARTGERPVPTVGARFETRPVAERAAAAAEQYRTALRRYDPRLPHHDLVVSRTGPPDGSTGREQDWPEAGPRSEGGRGPAATTRTTPRSGAPAAAASPVELCHRIAAAVFETLCESGHRAVETAVMDAYFELAETVPDPDELCFRLLESVAAELDARLSPAERADVLTDAAARLPPREPAEDPVAAALETLATRRLLATEGRPPSRVDLAAGTRSVVVHVSEYALSTRCGRLPVLPLVLGVHRHRPTWPLSSVRVADADDGWRLTLVQSRDDPPTGLTTAPVDPPE